jgi:hypothetical protein
MSDNLGENFKPIDFQGSGFHKRPILIRKNDIDARSKYFHQLPLMNGRL